MEISHSKVLLSLPMQKIGKANKNNRIYNPYDIDYILPIFKSKRFKYSIYWNRKSFLEEVKKPKSIYNNLHHSN